MAHLLEQDRPIASEREFVVDEIVLAFHGNLLYEARVLEVRKEEGCRAHSYEVHFQGWKKSWNESVSHTLVFEHNNDNLRIAHRLLAGAKMRQQALLPAEEKDTKTVEKNLPPSSPPNAMFQIPPPLQRQLVDDWEFVTKERKLVPLPRQTTVQTVLQNWVQAKKQPADKATQEVAEALQIYFDASLSKLLLYRFERQQYNDMVAKDPDGPLVPSAVYGPEHLLRLLLKLPYLLESSAVDRERLQSISEKVNELAKYMQKTGRILFLSEYEAASDAYLKAVEQQS